MTASDAQSGISSVDFPAIFATGPNAGTTTVGDDYESALYTFPGGGFSSPGLESVTARNGVTFPSAVPANDQLTISADSASPLAFSLAGPADGASVSDGVQISAQPTDADSGLRQVDFLYCDRTADALCDPSLTIGTVAPLLGIYSLSWSNTALIDGHDYTVVAVATDNVGHTTTSSPLTLLVDNSPPAIAVTAPTTVTTPASQYYDAGSRTLWLKADASGSFRLNALATDPDSGIAKLNFSALLGTSAHDVTGASPYQSNLYSFGPGSNSGFVTMTASNGVTAPAVATTTDSIEIANDLAAPATTPTFPLNNDTYATGTWSLVCAVPGICGTVADVDSGVANVKLSVRDATTGKYYDGAGFTQTGQTPYLTAALASNAWSYGLDDTMLTAPHVYLVEVFATDNVGNVETHHPIRFTFGDDTGAPMTSLSLSAASHASLLALGTGDSRPTTRPRTAAAASRSTCQRATRAASTRSASRISPARALSPAQAARRRTAAATIRTRRAPRTASRALQRPRPRRAPSLPPTCATT